MINFIKKVLIYLFSDIYLYFKIRKINSKLKRITLKHKGEEFIIDVFIRPTVDHKQEEEIMKEFDFIKDKFKVFRYNSNSYEYMRGALERRIHNLSIPKPIDRINITLTVK